jgi:hypothetical protein
MMMTTLVRHVKHPKRPQLKANWSHSDREMPKILVQKGFRRAESMPDTLKNFLATRAESAREVPGSASVVLGNVLRRRGANHR